MIEEAATVKLEDVLKSIAPKIAVVKEELGKKVFGQEALIEQLLVAILCRSHCILTGVPGLAKTMLIKTLSDIAELSFNRVQFTPDMLPADITGSQILEETAGGKRSFEFVKGPVFTQLLLADEINRTPPKTQSALLEAMEEHQVSIAGHQFKLPSPFFVLATQNPIEQEGTYPLPEAQQDRFMFSLRIEYPNLESETRILHETTSSNKVDLQKVIGADEILLFQEAIRYIPLPESVGDFAVRLVRATRPAEDNPYELVNRYLKWGAGPRACQYLALAGKAWAALDGRYNVARQDIVRAALPVLRHRLILNFRAQADNITSDQIINELLSEVEETRNDAYAIPFKKR